VKLVLFIVMLLLLNLSNKERKRNKPSLQEDNLVVKLVEQYGPKRWSTIALHLPGCIDKQCRDRYLSITTSLIYLLISSHNNSNTNCVYLSFLILFNRFNTQKFIFLKFYFILCFLIVSDSKL
jgi:Myb-like DNA-binding domain